MMSTGFLTLSNIIRIPVRHKWTDWRMAKDARKRRALVTHGTEKLRLLAMKRNDILPVEIREQATKQMLQLTTDVLGPKIQGRCAVTSKPRGNVLRWRLSRMVFRDLSDHGMLSGIQRAMW